MQPVIKHLIRLALLCGLMLGWIQASFGDYANEQISGPLLSVPAIAPAIDLTPYLRYWHQSRDNGTITQAQSAWRDGEFDLLDRPTSNMGFEPGVHWFLFSLLNKLDSPRKIFLEVDYPMLDSLSVFCGDPQGNIDQELHAGDRLAPAERPIRARNHVFPVQIKPGQILQCWLSVRSTSNILVPIRVYDEISYVELSKPVQRNIGIVYGLAFALLIYNLIQLLATREKLHLIYSVHVLSLIVALGIVDGSLSDFWIQLGWQNLILPAALAVASATFLAFSIDLLELRSFHRIWYYLGVGLIAVLLLGLTTIAFLPLQKVYAMIIISLGVASLYAIGVGVHRVFSGFQPAIVFLMGFLGLFVVVIWIVLNMFGVSGDVRWVIYGGHVAWICELLVLSLAVAVKTKQLERDQQLLTQKIETSDRVSDAKTQFIERLNQDIRIPANGVIGIANGLRKTPLNDVQLQYVDTLRRTGDCLLTLANDSVKGFGNDALATQASNQGAFNLETLLQDLHCLTAFELEQQQLSMSMLVVRGTPTQLVGDDIKIRRILVNLVTLVIKCLKPNDLTVRVQLTDRIENEHLVIRFVLDCQQSWVRLLDQQQDKQQLEQMLARVQQMAACLGAVVVAKLGSGDESLGEPTCFFDVPLDLALDTPILQQDKVVLGPQAMLEEPLKTPANNDGPLDDGPLDDSPLDDSPAQTVDAEQFLSPSGARVLVVEDNLISLNVIQEFLKKLGLVVESVTNGAEAVNKVKSTKRPFDLILMDCETPIMNGYQAAEKIISWQQDMNASDTPIIALSAHTMEEYRRRAKQAGMVGFISKPFTMQELRNVLAQYISIGTQKQ